MSRLRGRFERPTDPRWTSFPLRSRVDLEMAEEDVEGSNAHAAMLGEMGILSSSEVGQMVDGLEKVRTESLQGEFRPGLDHEDIHMAVEARLEASHRSGCRQATHCPITQRSSCHRPASVAETPFEIDSTNLVRLMRSILERIELTARL